MEDDERIFVVVDLFLKNKFMVQKVYVHNDHIPQKCAKIIQNTK